ncbi:APC family permease [Humidisolicoccus flavus]|uniref:APC family permease n=1 Tax=Humidisolicoccus flavus TaxID=3111414 RepID=UPI00324BBE2B
MPRNFRRFPQDRQPTDAGASGPGSPATLQRRIGTFDATLIGLGSMLGAGVFAAFTPAAQAAGDGILIALLIAACVALCNATSTAQLAAQYPSSGGTYLYGRQQLGPWWGYIAGWGFVVGKTASASAIALTFAWAVAPDGWERPVAIITVITLAFANWRGITRTAQLTRILVVLVVLSLMLSVLASWGGTPFEPFARLAQFDPLAKGWYGILQASGLLFFAFAGYARIATLGEEVKNPERTIPRAILGALSLALLLAAVVAFTLLTTLGSLGIAQCPAPLVTAIQFGEAPDWMTMVPRIGAAVASLGALLGLLAGISRTTLAMARERDLPAPLARIQASTSTPSLALLVITVITCGVLTVGDFTDAIGFSSFGVLIYYAITNVAAFTQSGSARRYPRIVQAAGLLCCLALIATLPPSSILLGFGVFAVGIALRVLRLGLRRRSVRRSGSGPS